MKIEELFIREILSEDFPDRYQDIYDNSLVMQYFDKKMKAIHGNSKTRRSLANIYAIFAILHFYVEDFYNNPQAYTQFAGYGYMKLLAFIRSQYGGSKLQNHALNSRVNGEFKNKFPQAKNDLIIIDNGKYLIHIEYLYVNGVDISKTLCKIITKYIELLITKDHDLIRILNEMQRLNSTQQKKKQLESLLSVDSEARIFEIISYAILKNHYKNIFIYWGYSPEDLQKECLTLYRTGRTNANDGGIDFVMRPLGRFFQATEVDNYEKFLLDIDKVMHFPVSFVVKTCKQKEIVKQELIKYIEEKANGMKVIEERYKKAIEEIITLNELKRWMGDLNDADVDEIISDIDIFYKLEMNLEDDEEVDSD